MSGPADTLLSEIVYGNPLNASELEALHGAALGETARQTAVRTNYAEESVRSSRKVATAKLGAPNIVRAVVVAIASGVLNIADLVDDDL